MNGWMVETYGGATVAVGTLCGIIREREATVGLEASKPALTFFFGSREWIL